MTGGRLLRGIGVSPGVAIGPARIVDWELPEVEARTVPAGEVQAEVSRLHGAISEVRALMESLRARTEVRAGPEEAKIFDAQIMMLEDQEFLGQVEKLIQENQLTAERAFEFKALEMRIRWGQSPNPQLRQRTADISGISISVLKILTGHPVDDVLHRPDGRPLVVFTRQLTPGLTVQFEREHVAGFASDEGTQVAHAAILARSMGIPCVMGLVGGVDRIQDMTEVLLDGTRGTVLLDPTPSEIDAALERERRRRVLDEELEASLYQPAVTLDGTAVTLRGNLDLPEDLESALHHGAEGIGLLRTEFLLLGRTELPSEDEQAQFFQRVAERFTGRTVIVRSYDLGGDKFPAAFRSDYEANPFLGWRAIRVCLDHPQIFRTQIRAILRARLHGDAQLLLPLVTQVEEVERTRELVVESADALRREGIPAAETLPLGVMIETPAAALLVDQIAERSDFLSVGTNDLTQYTLAVDRGNARLAGRFTPLHPAVVRMLRDVVEVANTSGCHLSVCGEMASEPISAFLLLGLGYRVLSVAPKVLPLVRWFVRQVDLRLAQDVASVVVRKATARDIIATLEEAVGKQIDPLLLDVGRLPGDRGEATLRAQI